MTALIWMLTWLLQLLPAMSELPTPVNVILTSNHFRHLLKWEPGPGTPPGVYYRVMVNNEMGIDWQSVAGCERIQHPLVCNLTQAFSDLDVVYFTQVTALLETQASKPFNYSGFQPNKDTHLDLPLLTVTSCGSNLCVDLQPPMKHLRNFYESLHYKLRIQCNGVDREKDTMFLRREVLENLAPGRQYCVSVCFSDTVVPRSSNYSQPVCTVTPGNYNADPWISAVLCVLVMIVMVVVALLFFAGFICLAGRPLPQVLTSIRHTEADLVIAPCSTSVSSLLNLKSTAPSSGEKRSSQTSSDESDEESVTKETGGSRGGDYKLRVGSNLLSSSSSSSSSSLSAPESPEPESTQTSSDSVGPRAVALTSTETCPSTHTASHSDRHTSDPPGRSSSLTGGGGIKEEEDSQDVNLLTLTFGRHEVEEQEEGSHVESSSAVSGAFSTTPLLPAQTWDNEEVAIEIVSCTVNEEEEEEEEDEDFGYMRRS